MYFISIKQMIIEADNNDIFAMVKPFGVQKGQSDYMAPVLEGCRQSLLTSIKNQRRLIPTTR
jgi:hypothetical protein